MPGSGKSTIGRLLGKNLQCDFVDLDELIEGDFGKSIDQIFNDDGESFFRDHEAASLRSFVKKEEAFLLATGGGTPCYRRSMSFIKKSGISIYLDYDHKILASRIWDHGLAERPMLKDQKGRKELEKKLLTKLKRRSRFYERADIILKLSAESVPEVVKMISKKLYSL